MISKEDWIGRRLVADRFCDRRVFICGDAAHLWIPHAGYGMNAGIADAANLSWMLAATLNRWAPPAMLEAYGPERQPITDQVSRFITDVAMKIMKQRREIPAEIEAPGDVGDAVRARVGKEAYDLDIQQQCCAGLNFGYFYDASPIIAYDGEAHPAYTMGEFGSSTVPGCRAPHFCSAIGARYMMRLDQGSRSFASIRLSRLQVWSKRPRNAVFHSQSWTLTRRRREQCTCANSCSCVLIST